MAMLRWLVLAPVFGLEQRHGGKKGFRQIELQQRDSEVPFVETVRAHPSRTNECDTLFEAPSSAVDVQSFAGEAV
jgi:hypothetical protein